MKHLILIIMILSAQVVFAQNLSSIPNCEDCKVSENVLMHEWQCGYSNGRKMMTYHFDDGVYRMNSSISILKRLLNDNNLSYNSPHKEDSYISDLVGDDLSMLDITITTGNSYMTKLWTINDSNGNPYVHVYFEMNEENRIIALSWK